MKRLVLLLCLATSFLSCSSAAVRFEARGGKYTEVLEIHLAKMQPVAQDSALAPEQFPVKADTRKRHSTNQADKEPKPQKRLQEPSRASFKAPKNGLRWPIVENYQAVDLSARVALFAENPTLGQSVLIYREANPVSPKDYLLQLRKKLQHSQKQSEIRSPEVLSFGHADNRGYLLHYTGAGTVYMDFILFIPKTAVHILYQMKNVQGLSQFYQANYVELERGIRIRKHRSPALH